MCLYNYTLYNVQYKNIFIKNITKIRHRAEFCVSSNNKKDQINQVDCSYCKKESFEPLQKLKQCVNNYLKCVLHIQKLKIKVLLTIKCPVSTL